VAYFLTFFKNLNQHKMNAEQLIKEKKGTIVDVRTPSEFMGGHVSGSINIPLQEIPNRMDELKNLAGPLVLCCASGNRSAQATHYLTEQGINCCNGGSWLDVNYYQTQTV
jgi:phage shock protein E